jgi:predicted DNA-binding transcriptional regulator AlpA
MDLHEDLLTANQVRELLHVSRSWVYVAAKSGRIPCVRLGGPDGPVRFGVLTSSGGWTRPG